MSSAEVNFIDDRLSDEGIDELSTVIAVAFCVSIKWIELTQTFQLMFENGRPIPFFVADRPRLRQLIEQSAAIRGLPIRRV